MFIYAEYVDTSLDWGGLRHSEGERGSLLGGELLTEDTRRKYLLLICVFGQLQTTASRRLSISPDLQKLSWENCED